MKTLIIFIFCISSSLLIAKDFKRRCSFKNTYSPSCFHAREKPELNISLVHYGEFWKKKDLDRLEPILKERFYEATGKLISINILSKKIVPLKRKIPKRFKFNGITNPDRLKRIWYYERDEDLTFQEFYYDYKKIEDDDVLNKIDTIAVITETQFKASSSTFGQMLFTEQPQEVAFGLKDKGRTEVRSDYAIVDSLIHELGHIINLEHASTQCTEKNLSYKERLKCCNNSPTKNDVMSYCRHRSDVNETFMYGFESCNREIIENHAIPALLDGKKIDFKYKQKCN